MDTERVRNVIRLRGGRVIEHQVDELNMFVGALKNDSIRDYLMRCMTEEGVGGSDIYLTNLESTIASHAEGAAPMSYIVGYGFLGIGGTGGGNAICVDVKTGKVYWADHERFSEKRVRFVDKETGQWKELTGLDRDRILLALIVVADDLETFLIKMLGDELMRLIEGIEFGRIKG